MLHKATFYEKYIKRALDFLLSALALVVLSMVTLLMVWLYKQDAQKQYDAMRNQAISLEQENSRLQQAIEQLGTIQGIAYIAKEQLGLVDPDTIIIEPEN